MKTELAFASLHFHPKPLRTPDGIIENDLRAGGDVLCASPCYEDDNYPRPRHKYRNTLRGVSAYDLTIETARKHGVRVVEAYICGRVSFFDWVHEPVLTLLILAYRDNTAPGVWTGLVREFRGVLHDKGWPEMPVEVIDPAFFLTHLLHPCQPEEAIFPIWKDVADEIIAKTDLAGILTVGCFRVGGGGEGYNSWYQRHEKYPPTVVLGVDPHIQRDWREAREGVVRILDSRGLDEVAVLIRKDMPSPRIETSRAKPVSAEHIRPGPSLDTKDVPHLSPDLYTQGQTGCLSVEYANLQVCLIIRKVADGEAVILPTWKHIVILPHQTPFAREHDSGTMVVDTFGGVYGMIFATSGTGNCDLGYFTSTEDLLDDLGHAAGVRSIRFLDREFDDDGYVVSE
ncbi:hypothetical protein BJY01DRAFT_251433 [Aspergillus pseudoustus]|uniref:Uncharacterized protein n=1 Tax=Aspergillus pseudoustus TaxID=1810923 RepID=A0ABR4JBL6_9EURO